METIPFDIEKFKAGWKLVHEGWGIELYRFVLLPEGEAVYINWSKGGESVKYYLDNLHSSVYKFRLLSPYDENSFEKWKETEEYDGLFDLYNDTSKSFKTFAFIMKAAYEAGKKAK